MDSLECVLNSHCFVNGSRSCMCGRQSLDDEQLREMHDELNSTPLGFLVLHGMTLPIVLN